MSWRQTLKTRVAQALFGDVLKAEAQAAVTRAQQALPVGFGADADLIGYRRLLGRGQDQAALRDIPLPAHDRMQQICYALYVVNPMAQWWINTQRAYIVGEGVAVTAKDADAQTVLNTFWQDPVNNWPIKLGNKVRELAIYGEQCWPAFTAQGTGLVRLGYLDPCLIDRVVLDPDNAEQPIGVITRSYSGYVTIAPRKYRVILPIAEDELLPAAQALRAEFADGECFYYAVNKVSNASRGWADLLAKADWLDAYERFMFNRVERADLMNRIVGDLKMVGATEPEVQAFQQKFVPPPPGGYFIHNDKMELEYRSPDLHAVDAQADARMFKHQCLAPMPEHWYGGGGDVNRATAGEMDESTFKHFKDRQAEWKGILLDVCRYQIRQAKQTGALRQAADETVAIVFPEMVKADTAKQTTAVSTAADAVTKMRQQSLITREEARKICAVAVQPMGVTLDPMTEAELQQMADAEQERIDTADYLDRRLAEMDRDDAQRQQPGDGPAAPPNGAERNGNGTDAMVRR